MSSDVGLPSIDGLEIFDIFTTHRFRDTGEAFRIPPQKGGPGSWAMSPQGIASARLWAITWTGNEAPPRGVLATWEDYPLENSWDVRRSGKQSVTVTAVLKSSSRRLQFALRYRSGRFEGGTWSEEVGREPRTTGALSEEPGWLTQRPS